MMIIECRACRARFKLDESKIRGKGARIRCRKCGESIIVMKSDIPSPSLSPPIGKERFDLRAVLREPERKTEVPPPAEVGTAFDPPPPFREAISEQPPPPATEEPAPPTVWEQEALAQEPTEPAAEPVPPPRDEVDAAFESPLFHEEISEQPPPPATEEPAPPTDYLDTSFSLELEKEEDLSFFLENGQIPASGPKDLEREKKPSASPPKEEGRESGQQPEEFLNIDTVLPEFLRKKEPGAEPAMQFDISERLSMDLPETPEEDAAPVPPMPDQPLPAADSPLSRADSFQDELAELLPIDPVLETSVPESPSPDIPPLKPLESERLQVTRLRPPAPSGKPSIALLAILFVTLAGGGGYLAFTKSGQETLRAIVPGMESLWLGGKESILPYHVGNLIGYYETGDKAGKMFVIKGEVTNQGRNKKSGIRIRAELLDGNHQTIAEKTAYAGNVISGLRSAEREKIEAAMSNHFGDKLSNVDVAPGKSIPFMVTFFDPPEGIEEYRLEAMDGD